MARFPIRARRPITALALSAALAAGAFAAGPEVGETVPAFEAPDQSGSQRDFESLAGDKGLLLLFFRSADW